MYLTTWDTKELLTYCRSSIIQDAEVHVKSFVNKMNRISFIFEKLSKGKIPPLDNKTEFIKVQIQTEIDIESLAFNLHSLADVCSHIIYYLVLKPNNIILSERQININKVNS